MQAPSFQGHERVLRIRCIEAHTGGEPLRILYDGLPALPGRRILDKRRYFRDHYDGIRKALMWEPRGHADMYGAVLTGPENPGADVGVFFLHNAGYSTMCGHAIIALTRVLLETGMVDKPGERPTLLLDTPAGQVRASAEREGNQIRRVSFRNVPSFVFQESLSLDLPGYGPIDFDLAFGGAFYAYCQASALGLELIPSAFDRMVAAGRAMKAAVASRMAVTHPLEADLSFLYGTIFVGPAQHPDHHSRNVCVFADGEVDRSPTGTGVSGRAALHVARGELSLGESITIESLLGTTMSVRVLEKVPFGPYEAIIPEVSGTAYITGQSEWWIDPEDPLREGFIFR